LTDQPASPASSEPTIPFVRPWMILAFGVVGACALLFIVPLILNEVLGSRETRFIDDQRDIERWIGVDLPSDASGVKFHSYGFYDYTLWMTFSASSDSVDTFLTELGFTEPLEAGENPFLADQRDDLPRWWQANGLQTFSGGDLVIEESNSGPRYYAVVVDESGGSVQVFMRVYDDDA